ncbi:site-specific integrase [Blautia schinkii]|nr:site-specific integrase [Blautia schinkii]
MARRGENIRKRSDGRWEARYEKTRKPDGTIQYGYLYAKTYEEVKRKKVLALQHSFFNYVPEESITFGALCQEWKATVRCSIKESSYACYDTLLDTHIIPWFKKHPLNQISTEFIQKFTYEKTEAGLSPRTVKSLLILLQNILRYGEQMGYLSMRGIQIRYPKITNQTLNIIAENHLQKLISTLSISDEPFASGILLCIYTGIRVGELCGLQWQDLNFNQGIISIRRTVSRIKNLNYIDDDISNKLPKTRINISTPKSLSSIRDIPIPDFLLERLEKQRTCSGDFMLTGCEQCMEPRGVQRKFQALLQECEIPKINIHSLRHTFATRCTEIGFDSKTLSEILGHSSPKITMDIYVHSNMNQKRNFMNHLYY